MKFPCYGLFFLLLLAAAPAWGAAQEFCEGAACYTADMPAQWKAESTGSFGVSFFPPTSDETMAAHVLCQEYFLPDAALLAREHAAFFSAGDSLRALPDGQGFLFQSGDIRIWLMESGGTLVRIMSLKAHEDLQALLSGFKSQDGNLNRIFTTLAASPAALDWLCFTGSADVGSPLPPAKAPVLPDFSTYGAIEGENGLPPQLSQQGLPYGWSHQTIGQWIVATPVEGGRWAAARLYPIAAADENLPNGAPLAQTAKEIAPGLGGNNLIVNEGSMLFATPSGRAELDRKTGPYALLCLYSDSDTEMELMGFVTAPGTE